LAVAAAGSGKIYLFVNLIAKRLIDGQIDPPKDDIVVLMFTNNTADELIVRLSAALDMADERESINRPFA